MVAPFVLLLLAIALLPFVSKHHWENHYPKVAIAWADNAAYYVVVLHNTPRMLLSLVEYVGFMALIGSLYVIAGGIHINMTRRSTPGFNTGLLALGAILANLIGTTGAIDVVDSAISANQQAPGRAVSRRVFHLPRQQCRRGAHTHRRSTVVPGLPEGVPFFWLIRSRKSCWRGCSAWACCWRCFSLST